MYESCLNDSEGIIRRLSICLDTNDTIISNPNEELVNFVSLSVFILFGLIGLTGLIGNFLVVTVVTANPLMRSTTNILIINLAIADMLFVIFCVPFTAADYIYTDWPFGNFWCKFVQYMIFVTCHVSVYTLIFMSVDRFLAVCHPITSISIRTERNAVIAIIFAWILILTSAFPVGITHGELYFLHKGEIHSGCLFLSEEGYSHPGFQISFFLSSYLIPLTLISILYIEMLVRLWKAAPGGKSSAESRRGKRRVTRLVVVVVLVFAFCWCPIQIVLVLKSLNMYKPTHATITIQIISHVLAYLNSCINPVLYAFLSDNFRKAFKKVIWRSQSFQMSPKGAITTTRSTKTATGTTNCPSSQHPELV